MEGAGRLTFAFCTLRCAKMSSSSSAAAAGDGKSNEVKLDQAPTDGISSLVFANASDSLLLSSSWDKSVRLYDVSRNKLLQQYEHKAAVLDVAFSADDQATFSGGIDRQLIMYALSFFFPSLCLPNVAGCLIVAFVLRVGVI